MMPTKFQPQSDFCLIEDNKGGMWMRPAGVMKYLKVSKARLGAYVQQGRLKFMRVTPRLHLYDADSVMKLKATVNKNRIAQGLTAK